MSYTKYLHNVNIESGNVIQVNRRIKSLISNSSKFKVQIWNVLKQQNCRWIILLISCNSAVVYYLWNWSASTNSLALQAYVNTVVFNVCALAVCLISIWVEQNTLRQSQGFAYSGAGAKSSGRGGEFAPLVPSTRCKSNSEKPAKCQSLFSDSAASLSGLGPEKYEVLALLLASCFSLIAAFLLVIDALSRIKQQPVVHEGRLGLGAVLGLTAHLVTKFVYPDAGLDHVVCRALPCPTLNGVNPILGSNIISFVIICVVHTTVHLWGLHTIDTAAVFAVVGLTVASMLPLAFYTASTILLKLSHHMSEQLDKCLREALIIDGVLEFRNEKFWTKSFGKLAGSLEVRIRKNANEHFVLQEVVKRLSQVVATLNVQEFREPMMNGMKRDFAIELPLEYYMQELLPDRSTEECPRKQITEKESIDEENIVCVKIDEILNPTDQSKKFKLKDHKQSESAISRNVDSNSTPLSKYSSFPTLPVRNLLLMNSNWTLDDFASPVRLHCQP